MGAAGWLRELLARQGNVAAAVNLGEDGATTVVSSRDEDATSPPPSSPGDDQDRCQSFQTGS